MLQERLCKYCNGKMPEVRGGKFCHDECRGMYNKGHVSVRPRGQTQAICPQCEALFEPSLAKQIYCTKLCRRLAIRQVRHCTICGCDVLKHGPSKQTSRATLCSPECRAKYKAAVKHKESVEKFGPPRTCRWCGVTFGYGGEAYKDWCSRKCRKESRQDARKKESAEREQRQAPIRFGPPRVCEWCKSIFRYGDGGYHKWCSESCRAEQVKDSNKRHRQQRRAREAAAMVECVSPAYIFKRDKYICQSCKKKTKPKEATTHPLYPNLDHIIPLSKGGEHSRKNCQCLCRACNIEKSNGTLNDQLLLFG